jgi:hypothetical protein
LKPGVHTVNPAHHTFIYSNKEGNGVEKAKHSSLVNGEKLYTIETNLKVQDTGQIDQDSSEPIWLFIADPEDGTYGKSNRGGGRGALATIKRNTAQSRMCLGTTNFCASIMMAACFLWLNNSMDLTPPSSIVSCK